MKLLLVEDDDDFRIIIKEKLTNLLPALEVVEADSGEACMDRIYQSEFDCILMDYVLPDSDASDLVQILKSFNKHLPPIIILTSMQTEEVGISMVKMGVQDFISKRELNDKTLLRSINYAIERNTLTKELEESQKQEHYMAYHDPLTSLLNRPAFYKRLQEVIFKVKRESKQCGVFFVDLDGFKKVNDGMGHVKGDELLKTVSQRILECVRESDTVARLGGDEFTIILPDVSNGKDAAKLAEKILERLNEIYWLDHQEVYLSASIGISMYPFDGKDAEVLVKCADIAMYRAKKEGKNTFQFYDKSMEIIAFERLALETSLRKAVENEEFEVYYQPQISLQDEKITGVEALIRWNHPEMGILGPNKFISLAEESGLIIPIGKLMMKEALAQCQKWNERLENPIRLTVNLSMVQFRDPKMIQNILGIVEETGFSPKSLGLEITESSAADDIQYTKYVLSALKESGLQVLIDDFGTGYSSLAYLNRLPIDKLKIDHTFMRGIPLDENNVTLVSAIVAMAQKLKLKVVAEGVETKPQMEFLKSLNCDEVQGFYFSRPIPAKKMEEYILGFQPFAQFEKVKT